MKKNPQVDKVEVKIDLLLRMEVAKISQLVEVAKEKISL